jgi:hypothetical protein
MKSTIVDGNTRTLGSGIYLLQEDLIVDSEFAFWHSREVGLHHGLSRHIRTEGLSFGGNEDVDGLDDVDEDLVFLVRRSPRDCSSGSISPPEI